jgi:hypothetical protein
MVVWRRTLPLRGSPQENTPESPTKPALGAVRSRGWLDRNWHGVTPWGVCLSSSSPQCWPGRTGGSLRFCRDQRPRCPYISPQELRTLTAPRTPILPAHMRCQCPNVAWAYFETSLSHAG